MRYMKKESLKKIVVLMAVLSLTSIIFSGCKKKENALASGSNDSDYETLEIKYQGWTGQVILVELAEELGYLEPLKLSWVGNTISGPQDIQSVATGDIDIGSAFGTAIVNLKAAGAPIKWVINTGGCDDKVSNELLVLNDSPIKSARDLIGKKIGVNTLGAHNEIVIKEYLRSNGVSEDEIKEVSLVVTPPVNTEQALREKQLDAVMLGGIFKDKAYETGGLRKLTSDYETLNGPLSSSGLVLNEKFIRQNPKTTKKLIEGIGKAIEWSKETPREEVIEKFEEIIKKRERNENDSAVKYYKSFGVPEKGGQPNAENIQLWIDLLIKDGKLKEGQIEPSEIYTNEFSPYK